MKKYILGLVLVLTLSSTALAEQGSESVTFTVSKADLNIIVQALYTVRYDVAAPVLNRLNEQLAPKSESKTELKQPDHK